MPRDDTQFSHLDTPQLIKLTYATQNRTELEIELVNRLDKLQAAEEVRENQRISSLSWD